MKTRAPSDAQVSAAIDCSTVEIIWLIIFDLVMGMGFEGLLLALKPGV